MKLTENIHMFPWTSMNQNNCNTYLIDGPARILIDPGHAALFGHVRSGLADLEIRLQDIGLIFCTHAHPDHVEAVKLFQMEPARKTLHQEEWEMAKDYADMFRIDLDEFTPDFFVQEGSLTVDGLDFEVFHTPGHSPGSVCLWWPQEKALFSGDLIFKNGLGRTDLPGGDGKRMKESIRKMAQLDARWILPGHGEIISDPEAVRENFRTLENVWFSYV